MNVRYEYDEFQSITEHAPDIICRFGPDYRVLYVNPAIEKATGVPQEKFINKRQQEVGMPLEFAQFWDAHVHYVFRTGKQTEIEFPFLSPSGNRYFHTLLVPEYSQEGRVETVLSVSRDVTDLKEADQRKDEVVSMVSHELMTPITSLKSFTELLYQQYSDEGDVATVGHLSKISGQINKLSSIIQDLMEAARIDKGSLSLKKERFDFNRLVQETVEEMKHISKVHTFLVEGRAKVDVVADRSKLGRVLTNLLSNAIKYTPQASKIIIRVASDKNNVECSVQDFGIGIPKDKIGQIFDRFYRASSPKQASYTGLGLGLYITREIIRKHGGKIWVESEPDKGTTFHFTLPLYGQQDA